MQNTGSRDLEKYEPQAPQLPAGGQMVWVPAGYELAGEQPAQAKESHLWDYIWLVWRGRWLVVLCFVLCSLIAGVRMYRMTPIYQGSGKLLLGGQAPQIVNLGKIDASDRIGVVGGSEQISTQMQVLMSKNLARDVVEELNLYGPAKRGEDAPDQPEPSWGDKLLATVTSLPSRIEALVSRTDGPKPSAGVQDSEEAAKEMMALRVAAFRSRLSVVNTPNTDIVEVRFVDTDPARCAVVVNAVCDAYVKTNYDNKTNSFEYASKWIDQKLYEVKANLEKSEETLYQFEGGQDSIALAEGAAGAGGAHLEATTQELRQVEQDLHNRQFELEALKKGVPGEVVLGTASAAPAAGTTTDATGVQTASPLASLRAELRKCEVDLALAAERFGPGMTEVKTLKATKEQLEAQIKQLVEEETSPIGAKNEEDTKRGLAQTQRVLTQKQYAYDQLVSKREFLQAELAALTERQLTIQQKLIKYNILKREVDVNKDIYNSLLQRSREVGLTSGLNASGVSVVERADPPRVPIYPNKQKTVLLGALLGLFIGVGLVFFREYMDTTVRGALDVEQIGRMSTLGLLPHVESRRSKKGGRLVPELLCADEPTSGFAESVRQIRTALQYSLAGHSPKTILVTSALPSEGKTTVATNLAIALAQNGRRTVLIDTDLKNPSVHKVFGITREDGLSDILAGKVNGTLDSHLIKTETENLYVLPSGTRPPNPVDLLDSGVMRRLLTALADKFDHVILDSTPSLDLADTGVLLRYVEGVVLVVKPGKTPRATLVRVRQTVTGLGGHVLGVVLNNRKSRSSKRYGGYRYLYGYGSSYGYGHTYGEKETVAAGAEQSGLALPPPRV